MHQRRSHGETKSANTGNNPISNMATTITASNASTLNRVSIYSMRERVILNKMTRIMGKLAPDTETEVTSRLHQEIPAIKLDGHLTYALYVTIQNIIHINAIYILLYHAVFWTDSNNSSKASIRSSKILENTKYEQTFFILLSNEYHSVVRKAINTDIINKYIYISLIAVGSIELLSSFLWIIRERLPYLIQKSSKMRQRLKRLLVAIIILIHFLLFIWLLYHTFITFQLTYMCFTMIVVHLIIITYLDKPNLFKCSPTDSVKQSIKNRKLPIHSASSSVNTSVSMLTNASNRSPLPPSLITAQKIYQPINNSSMPPTSCWSSITDGKIHVHECSTIYGQAREEADDIWPNIRRRIILNIYRTLSSFILFDFIPIKTMDDRIRSINNEPIKFFICINILITFLTHSTFLFPVKLQTAVHRIATHLGVWRQQFNIRTETIDEWSAECNSYTRGSVVKIPSNNKVFIAIQHLSNAADPQSKSHAIIYRLFGDGTFFLTVQFLSALILILLHVTWTVCGKYWEQILIGCLMSFSSSYSVFRLIRDRVILDFVDEHEYFQTTTIPKQKKSS